MTETVKRLAAQGLVEYQPYRPVVLTDVGAGLAVAMVRRHRLIETFLVTVLGYEWDQVHEEAERLEHAATDSLIDRIDDHLGHPVADPHGDPIPDPTGRITRPPEAVRLVDAPAGMHTVARVSDTHAEDLTWAARAGVRPGAVLSIERSETGLSAVVDADGQALPIPPGPAEATWVTPAR